MIKKFTNMYEGLAALQSKKTGFYYGIHSQAVVTFGEEGGVNTLTATHLGYKLINMERGGGCMVFAPRDISFAVIRPTHEQFNTRLIEFLVQKLKECGKNVCEDHNDIIMDGHYKVAGCTRMDYDGAVISFLHVSITDNHEDIQKICYKPRKMMPDGQRKEPSGLSRWGITEFQVEQWWLEFLNINYPKEIDYVD